MVINHLLNGMILQAGLRSYWARPLFHDRSLHMDWHDALLRRENAWNPGHLQTTSFTPPHYGWWLRNPYNPPVEIGGLPLFTGFYTVDMVNISGFTGVLYIPSGCLGFLNYQQHEMNSFINCWLRGVGYVPVVCWKILRRQAWSWVNSLKLAWNWRVHPWMSMVGSDD